jgi:hypothetical protein
VKDERVVRRTSLRSEDLRDLVAVQATRAEPVNGLGGKRDQPAGPEDGGGLGDHRRVGTLGIDRKDTRHATRG